MQKPRRRSTSGDNRPVPRVYVTGHRNPDTDSIAAAIGYAELRGRLDPHNEYAAGRLGDCNAQTQWLLERSGAPEPEFLPHILLRACDLMQTDFPVTECDEPIRVAGLAMARAELDLVPIVDDAGALQGVVTSRALARRYIRETRQTSTLEDTQASLAAVVEVLQGELVTGEERALAGRVWASAMEVSTGTRVSEGDVVVVGNRADAQRLAIERGAALLVLSNGSQPDEDVVALAREHDAAVIVSPLDTYVSARMITLAAPCRAFMEKDPLTVTAEYLVDDVSEQIKEIHYGAAIVVDAQQRPVGLITRSDQVAPPRRRVVLVDHAEVEYLERVLAVDAKQLGREMFEATADVSEVSAEQIVTRDAKRYEVSGGNSICIAQVEVVGDVLLERKSELLEAMRTERERRDLHVYALMVTDVLAKGTHLLVAGDARAVGRAFDQDVQDSTIELPGVMSRKKEVAPKLLASL